MMKVWVDSLKSGAALEWAVHQATIAPTAPSAKNWKINKGVDPGIWPVSSLHSLGSRLDDLGFLQSKALENGKHVSWVHDYLHDASINHKDWPGFDTSKPSSHCFSVADNKAEALAKCYVKFLSGPLIEIPDGLEIHLPKMLHEACISADIQRIKYLLKDGAPVNERYAGLTPLHASIKYAHFEVLKLLLEAGADPRLGDRYDSASEEEDYDAPMYLACGEKEADFNELHYEATRSLVIHGADLKWISDEYIRAMMEDCSIKINEEVIHYILKSDRLESAKFLISSNIDVGEEALAVAAPRIKSLFAEKGILSVFDDSQPVFAAPNRPRRGLLSL